jgi:hypothetical protein
MVSQFQIRTGIGDTKELGRMVEHVFDAHLPWLALLECGTKRFSRPFVSGAD